MCLARVLSFRCVNFYGFETPAKVPVCSWKHPPGWYLDNLKTTMGIDSVRIPFSYEYASCEPEMQGLQELVSNCTQRNLSVILDYHRGYADHQGASPVEKDITFEMYSELWLSVLDAFADNPGVRALSLFNEYQGTNKTDAENLQIRLARIIESVHPGRYIYLLGCANWGTDCKDMYTQLSSETFVSRAMTEIHIYDFHGPLDPLKFPPAGTKVFVGEIGWMDWSTAWAKSTISYLRVRRIKDVCMWTIAHSNDTGNLYADDCETAKNETIQLFNSLYDHPQCLRGNHS